MEATLQEPSFPVELEQKIFEMAFDPTDQITNVRMTLVALRVLEWQVLSRWIGWMPPMDH